MGTLTRIAVGTTAAVGLLYVGGIFNLDDKITGVYQSAKGIVFEAGQEYFCPTTMEDVQGASGTIKPKIQTRFSDRKEATADISAYVAEQPARVQKEIAQQVYIGSSEPAREYMVVYGFEQLPYDKKLETLESMATLFEKQRREQSKIMK